MTTLHLVTGLYSCVNSFASQYVDPLEDHYVLVLFTERGDEPLIKERIRRLPGVQRVRFLRRPETYTTLLSDPEYLSAFTGGRPPSHLRVFLSHSTWLLNALASAFPQAGVTLFEEGMAGLYPDTLQRIDFIDRVVRVEYHDYLGSVRPLSELTHPELFEEIGATRFLQTLEMACGRTDARLDSGTVVLVEQYFDRKGKAISTDELEALYARAVRVILAKGYDVAYKPHPRHASTIFAAIAAGLPPEQRARLRLIDERDVPLESILLASRPAAVAGVNTTLLLTAPHMLGVPAFRIEADYGLRLSADLGFERLGMLTNHLLLRDRIPPLDKLPPLGCGAQAWAVMIHTVDSVPPVAQDPLLLPLRSVGGTVSASLPAVFQTLESSPATHVSFDLFDTLVLRPALSPADVPSLLDRRLSSELPAMARYSNARNCAVRSLRTSGRLAGDERVEYPIAAVVGETARLLGGALDDDTLQRTEANLERSLLSARGLGISLYVFAKRLGKTVGIVSDTFYSSEQLLDLIGHLLPLEPDFVFSSADANATKAEGTLFDTVLSELGIEPSALIHVGDNNVSDVESATARGVSAIHLPSASYVARRAHAKSTLWKGFRAERGFNLVMGLVANRFYDNPFVSFPSDAVSLGTPFALGYGIAGPALLGWSLWIAREARDLGYDRVAFLSRDGFVPKGIYERLRRLDPSLPPGQYLLASRRTAFQVFSGDPAHVAMTQFVHGMAPSNTLRAHLTTRFGPKVVAMLEPALHRAGLPGLDRPVTREDIHATLTVLADHATAIAEACMETSEAAERYYQAELAGADRPVIVDLGYSGSSQRAIMASLRRRVDGLYFATMEHAVEYAQITGARIHPWSQDRTFFAHGSVLEYLLTPVGLPECIGIDPTDGRPLFADRTADDPVNAEIQRGIHEFIDTVFDTFSAHTLDLVMRPDSAARALSAFIKSPGQTDAAMLSQAIQDDTVGRGSTRLLDGWEPGRTVLAD